MGRQISRLEKKLQSLELNVTQNVVEIQEVRSTLNCWLDAENTMWHQWSRAKWIINGDRNTNFFHQKALNQKDRNYIRGICDSNEVWQEYVQIMEGIILDYFSSIFTTNGPTDISATIDTVQSVVTADMNSSLTQVF